MEHIHFCSMSKTPTSAHPLTYRNPSPNDVSQLSFGAEEDLPNDASDWAVLIGQAAGVESVAVTHEVVTR